MSQPLHPWSLHWSSNGELSPMDRADLATLFLGLHLPESRPFRLEIGHSGTTGKCRQKTHANDLSFPHR